MKHDPRCGCAAPPSSNSAAPVASESNLIELADAVHARFTGIDWVEIDDRLRCPIPQACTGGLISNAPVVTDLGIAPDSCRIGLTRARRIEIDSRLCCPVPHKCRRCLEEGRSDLAICKGTCCGRPAETRGVEIHPRFSGASPQTGPNLIVEYHFPDLTITRDAIRIGRRGPRWGQGHEGRRRSTPDACMAAHVPHLFSGGLTPQSASAIRTFQMGDGPLPERWITQQGANRSNRRNHCDLLHDRYPREVPFLADPSPVELAAFPCSGGLRLSIRSPNARKTPQRQ
jgi:hypothetical protein